jgi:hypothetical protein
MHYRRGEDTRRLEYLARVLDLGRPRVFVIGAHSIAVGHLLTADPSFYRTNFPELSVLAL